MIIIYIYKISNTINNKVYIGQTIRPIEQRFKRHINDAINGVIDTHFARAIRKYGANKFYIEQIDEATNQEELTEKEQYWIRYYQSNNCENGYNETDAKYKSGGNTYQNKSESQMKIISEKIRKTKLGLLNPHSKRVKCLNTETNQEIIFDSLIQCQHYFGESTHRFITTRITGKTHSLYDGKWAISYFEKDYPEFNKEIRKRGTEILVYDKEKSTSTKFLSIREAARLLNIPRSKIQKEINGGKSHFEICNRYIISV